jgi:hypothetical protein
MRGIILIALSAIITGILAFFVLNHNAAFERGEQGATIAGVPKTTPLSEVETANEPQSSGTGQAVPANKEYIEIADKYLGEALPLIEPRDRFVLIDKINAFKASYQNVTGSDPVILRATARYIAAWSPFYYYIHPDARAILGPIIKMLERERVQMLNELAKQDARGAGRLATEDIEYYIEDIRKSAARRNSDFITFSIQDYEGYRTIFDELSEKYPEFLLGFVQSAHILFDDFYRMHEEVDTEYSDKTRKSVQDMQLAIRDLHKRALFDLAKIDNPSAQSALAKTVSVIASELSAHPKISDIIKSDYAFYKGIQL